jgi:ribosome-associated protein
MFLHKKGNTLRTATTKGDADKALLKGKNSGENAVNEILKTVLESLDESQAEDIISIDITGKSSIGDHMVVTSGRSNRHVSAICEQLLKDLKDSGQGSARTEGQAAGDWVLIDAGDVIVHVFRPEIREFYNIEKMWMAPETEDTSKH